MIAQSICTHYIRFENMGRVATLKKIGSKIWGRKNRVEKIGSEFLGGLFRKGSSNLDSSLLDCKLHAEKL